MNQINISQTLPPEVLRSQWVGIDLELYKAEKHKLHRPITGKFACLSIYPELGDTVYVLKNERLVTSALSSLNQCVWVFQNAKFDLTHLRRWAYIPPRKQVWDTMLIEQILFSGYYNSFSLQDLARRYLNVYIEKDVREEFIDSEEMTDEMLQYAAKDAWLNIAIAKEQKKLLKQKDFDLWSKVELPTLWAVMDMKSVRIDVNAWLALAEKHKKMQQEIDDILPFNPRSSKQVVTFLKSKGFKGMRDSAEKTLTKYIEKYPNTEATKYAKLTLESRGYGKRASTYGKNFVDNYLETDLQYSSEVYPIVHTIHTNYHTIGAETGRFSSSNPNMQNIPTRDTKVFRECFIARPGRKIIVADYGQQETRIAGYFSQDKRLLAILRNRDQDIFVQMVKMIYGQDVDKKHPLRGIVKNLTYGLMYGISAKGLSASANISEEEAQKVIDAFFSYFVELNAWIEQQKRKKNHRYVLTAIGRKIWLNPYSGQVERNAVNAPIQGTAADMMKLALSKVHQDWNTDKIEFSVVLQVHDELVLDVYEDMAEKIAKFVTKRMVQVGEEMCPGVPFIAEYGIGDSWASKG